MWFLKDYFDFSGMSTWATRKQLREGFPGSPGFPGFLELQNNLTPLLKRLFVPNICLENAKPARSHASQESCQPGVS